MMGMDCSRTGDVAAHAVRSKEPRWPWARVAGKRTGTTMTEIGERVLFLTRGPNREREWPFGTWLGLVTRTQEAFVGAAQGVVRAWTIKRVGEQGRWNAEHHEAAGPLHRRRAREGRGASRTARRATPFCETFTSGVSTSQSMDTHLTARAAPHYACSSHREDTPRRVARTSWTW